MRKFRHPAKLASDLKWVLWTAAAALWSALYQDVVGHTTITFIGSYNLTVAEPVLALAIVSFVLLLHRRKPFRDVFALLSLCFVAIAGVDLFRGLLVEPFPAIVSLRTTGAPSAFLLIAVYLPRDEVLLRKISSHFVAVATLLSLLLCARLVFGPDLFLQTTFERIDEINDGGRALSAQGALFIGVGAILLMSRLLRARRHVQKWPMYAILALLLCALILTRQATAIAASVTGMAIVFALARGVGSWQPLRFLAAACVAGTAILLYLVTPNIASPQYLASVLPDFIAGDTFQRAANLGTRQLVWQGLLVDFPTWSALSQGIGLPAGVRPTIFVERWGGVFWEVGLHSMYFGTLASAGVLGLAVYVGLLGTLTMGNMRRLRVPIPSVVDGASGLAIGALCAVYGYSYDIHGNLPVLLLVAAVAMRPAPYVLRRGRPIPPQYGQDFLRSPATRAQHRIHAPLD